MTALPGTHQARGSKQTSVLIGILVLVSLWPLYGAVMRFIPTDHADQRHGGENYPPKAIRACLAQLVLDGVAPYQYELPEAGKIAVVCKLAENRYGVQINSVVTGEGGSVTYQEITTFYQSLSRMKNILIRDGYIPVIPLP